MESNQTEALQIFDSFVQKYPGNDYVLNWYLSNLIDLNLIKKAGEIVEKRKSLVTPLVLGLYYHKAGKIDESINEFNKAFNNSNRYKHWVIENAVYYQRINYLITDKTPTTFIKNFKLSGKYTKMLETLTSKNDFRNKIELIKNDIASENMLSAKLKLKNSFISSLNNEQREIAEYYKGIVEYKEESFFDSEKSFISLLHSQNELILEEAVKYLLIIYKKETFEKNKIEKFVDLIDDMDNERLTYAAKDLIKKYKL